MKDYLNRQETPLPQQDCIITILYNSFDGHQEIDCVWCPYDEQAVPAHVTKPSDDYLGTAYTIVNPTIGFHAWRCNDSEFLYYKIIKSSINKIQQP